MTMENMKFSDRSGPVRRVLARVTPRFLLLSLAAVVLVIVGVFFAGSEMERHMGAVEAWLTDRQPWSSLVFIAFFVVAASFLFPESMLSILAGALFGMGAGLVTAVTGNLVAAALQYLLARQILSSPINQMLAKRPSLMAIQRAVHHNELKLQLLLRLTPLSPAMISYMLGAAGVRFQGFLLACLAMIPYLAVEVYAGYAGRHLARMAGRQGKELFLHDAVIVCGVIATIVVMVAVSRMAHDAVTKSVKESAEA
jgi:uncharacterized membrane protein YdjX (TVP38/TMEM64 family)